MAVKTITPQDAHTLLHKESSSVYIDVRTVREFSFGHPEGAVNIPVAFNDPAQGMVMNQDFVRVVEANFPKDKKVIVGCQAGPRSEAAARLLLEAGYTEVYSLLGGFGGLRESFGRVIAPGWSSLGLPVSRDNGEGVSYDSLAVKAKV